MLIDDMSTKLANQLDAGDIPWRKPSVACNPNIVCNGLERLALNLRASNEGYADDRWYPKDVAESLGYKVKAGEIGVVVAPVTAERASDGSYNIDIKKSYRVFFNACQLEGIEPQVGKKLPFNPLIAEALANEIKEMSTTPGGRMSAEIAAFNLSTKYQGIEVPELMTSKDIESIARVMRTNSTVLARATTLAHLSSNTVEHNAARALDALVAQDCLEIRTLSVWRTEEYKYGFRATLEDGDFRVSNMITEDDLRKRLGNTIASAAIDKLDASSAYNERTGRTTVKVTPADAGEEKLVIDMFMYELGMKESAIEKLDIRADVSAEVMLEIAQEVVDDDYLDQVENCQDLRHSVTRV